ncbi:MAG: sigma 54-interacting transcriptional regulator [Candidatus Aenigmatarchaeota archaeon]
MSYQEILNSPIIPSKIATFIRTMSKNSAPILIWGEEGTGKGLVAKLIHYIGDWKNYNFYEFNCRVLNETEIFDKLYSIFQEVNFGEVPVTIFFKDIDQLGIKTQLKLLEIIEDGIIKKGLETKPLKNLRIITSSSKDLKEIVNQGKFSEELYNRLNIFSIYIPPLRERADEIPMIAQYILKEQSKKLNLKKANISPNVLKLLKSYWWPGNLRELEHVIIRSAIFSEGENLMEKDLFFETDNEKSSFINFLKKIEERPQPLYKQIPSGDSKNYSLSLFLIELVHRIKNPLVSIKTFTQLLREKFDDKEFREYFYKIVTEDIAKIDSVLDGLLNYIKVNTPVVKKDTIHSILEETLKKYEIEFENKKIKIFKKYEKDLPETMIHDDQLRYIFNSVIQYALSSTPPNGSLGFLTKVVDNHKKSEEVLSFLEKDERQIEVLVVFTGYKKPTDKFEDILGITKIEPDEMIELELRLIKEIVQKNNGMMKLEINEKKPRTIIFLRLPIERRKVFKYQWT